MRQILTLLAAMLLTAYSKDSEVKAATMQEAGKTLVVYYSYTNNCHEIVTSLTSQLTADVMRIEPTDKTQKYEANNYAIGTALLNAIKANPNDAASYPAIDPVSITDLSQYQNIIIVTPLWWSQMAAIMQTYLFNYGAQMAGKNVGLIVSNHSSGISGVVADAERLVKNVTWMGDALWVNNANHSNRASLIQNWLPTLNFAAQTTLDKVYISIDGKTQSVTLVDNSATQALVEKLQQASVRTTLNNNGDFEVWGALGFSLPTSDEQITALPGDVILYNGSNICLFYGSNSWSYTRLGRINGLSESELRTFMKAGESNITITLLISESAGTVVALIDAIGTVEYNDDCKAKIDAARKAYEELTDAQKALVVNYGTLTTAETTYATLKYAAEQAAADLAAANAVIAKIDAIGTVEYNDDCKAKIDAAREAYEELTDAQKALVTNYDVLTTAETTYAVLKDAAEQATADLAAANAVIAKIDAIGTVEYNDDCKAKIDAAREAYEELTDAQKALVTNYDVLTTAEANYEKLNKNATEIVNVKSTTNAYIWYDLNGRRLQSQPNRKGVYIMNGKKYFIK